MTELEILHNVVEDYGIQIEQLETTIQLYSKDLSALYINRNLLRNNKSIVLELIEQKTMEQIDKDIFSDLDDDLSSYDNNE